MADDDKSLESIQLRFASGALPDDDVRLRGVWGRERLSRLFEFDLLLTRGKNYTDDELDQLLKAPCVIAMGPKKGDIVHGLLQSIEAIDHDSTTQARYIARMVPNLWLLTMTRTSRLYQDTTVPEMVTKILKSYGLSPANFDIRISRKVKSPKREYVVQYQESDRRFVERLLDEEGISYFFEHPDEDDGEEVIVVVDDLVTARPVAGDPHFHFRDSAGMSATDGDIRSFRRGHRVRALVRRDPPFDAPAGVGMRLGGFEGHARPQSARPGLRRCR